RRLTPILALPPIEEGLGRTNSSDAELYFDKVTETQVQRIKAFYKKDYEFFAKKGITFRERTFD
ncbi:MAG: sulfotransferase family 2 domain-containing protein, partial [Minisyncoccia bacterium]